MTFPSFRFAHLVALVALLALVGACGGSSASSSQSAATASTGAATAAGTPPAAPFAPVVAMAEPLVGRNRFALGIIDNKTNTPLPDAAVHFRFFEVQGSQGTLRFEADGVFRAPAREAGLAPVIEHRHPDGTVHPHANIQADVGVYTAMVTFDKPGQWGVQAQFTAPDGRQGSVTAAFPVAEKSESPVPGQQAPRSHQPTIKDVKDISEIDSSAVPNPSLHNLTIADAIASGKPTLVTFATPGYCSSQVCGPSVEIVSKMQTEYGAKANFIHVEVYKDFNKLTPSDTFTEWKLRSEPWFYIIDGKGVITDRFDGPTTGAELREALNRALGS